MDLSAVNTRPSEGQKIAGNYKKAKTRLHGLNITIENPAGSYRRGVGANGKPWKSRLPAHYGYFRGTAGSDGDHVDVFLGGHIKSPHVFVIDQGNLSTREHDEHKVMMGFASAKQARSTYCRAFSDGKGEQRIRRMVEMDVPEFKKWLKDGGGRVPLKRAAGGGVQNGPPPFDMTSEVPAFDQTEAVAEKPSALSAAGYGAASGATFNMADEIAGARAAAPSYVPEMVGPVPAKTLVGAARTGINALRGEETPEYTKARDEYRASEKAAEEAHPWVHTGAEIAGAIPSMAAMPEAGFARLPQYGKGLAKAAQSAAEYGGLSGAGEGEGVADRALKGATGIVSGIIGGPVGKLAGDAVGAGVQKFGAPVVQTVKGWFNNEGEAARRVGLALRADQELVQSGKAAGMSPQQWVAARQAGEPVTLADLGSANTQSLLRSAANTSPEARAQLEQVIQSRFLTQGDRVAGTVRGAGTLPENHALINGRPHALNPDGSVGAPVAPANARRTQDQIVAEYDAGRVPLYRQSYEDGDKQIFTPAIDRLTGSDIFAGAMKRAISSGKDRAVTEGYGSFTPAVGVGPSGNFIYGKPGSGPVYPNLQYWDQVKRELDDVASSAFRSGENGKGDVASKMATVLRGELDKEVPSYAKARGFAADYFGEKNALEAGRKLASKKMSAEDVSQIMRKMKPDERAIFREGYASELADRTIGNIRDTRDVTKAMFASPNERKLAAAVFGPGGMAMLQARMSLETIMDGARQAMGNSTTARQLIEAGLAGGALTGYASGWDPTETLKGAGAFAAARGAPGVITKVLPQVADSARHMIGKVDAKTAAKVAELLTSNDPRLLRQGYQMAAKSEAIMAGLKKMANRVALSGQTQTRGPVEQGFRALQGPMGARADDEQQRP